MSGYLNRVLAAIRNPGGSVHPVLGSVFSPPSGQTVTDEAPGAARVSRIEGHQAIGSEARYTAGQLSDAADAPLVATHSTVQASVAATDSRPSRSGAEDEVADGLRVAERPRSAEGARRGGDSRPESFVGNPPDDAHSGTHDGHDSAVTRESYDRSRRVETDVDGGLEPLFPRAQPRAVAAEGIESHPAAFDTAARRDARSDAAHMVVNRSRQAPREASDIQIHIGRIEVMAVAPPSPRPLPAPPQTSPSLSDYLNRRNGRPG
jgi:hypothetical protein